MFRKNDGSEKNDGKYVNLDEFNEDDLCQEIFNDQTEQLIWLLDEIEALTSALKLNITASQIIRVKNVAKSLIPCFKLLENHENKAIQKYCEIGLKKIDKLFPDLHAI